MSEDDPMDSWKKEIKKLIDRNIVLKLYIKTLIAMMRSALTGFENGSSLISVMNMFRETIIAYDKDESLK